MLSAMERGASAISDAAAEIRIAAKQLKLDFDRLMSKRMSKRKSPYEADFTIIDDD